MKKARMRTLLSVVVSSALLLFLVGCGAPGTPDSSSAADSSVGLGVSAESTTTTSAISDSDTATTTEGAVATMTAPNAKATNTTTKKTAATKTTAKISQTTTMSAQTTTKTAPTNAVKPGDEAYRLVQDAIQKVVNKTYFDVAFTGDVSRYVNGTYQPMEEYAGHGIFAPGFPISVLRHMEFYSTVHPSATNFVMCQHNQAVFYSHIMGDNKQTGQAAWSKKSFAVNELSENIALAEAAVAELRQLPSAPCAANAEIKQDTKYGAQSKNRSVVLTVPAAEFSQLYANSIRFFAFIMLEPDKTLQYTVSDGEVKYIINEEGYLYDMELHYSMNATGTKNGTPYQEKLQVSTDMRVVNYKEDSVLYNICDCLFSTEYEKVDNPGLIYYATLPTLS